MDGAPPARHERIRRQRWLGVGAILAAVPVTFIAWTLAVERVDPYQSPGKLLVVSAAILASVLVLGGMILLARTDPRWSTRQAVATYALIGIIAGLASGQEPLVEGLVVAALWPAISLIYLYVTALGLWPGA